MNLEENSQMTNLAFLLALSRRGGGGSGEITPEDVKDLVADYFATHKATTDVAGVIKIGNGIVVDEDGVASIDEEAMAEMIADILNSQTEEIDDQEIEDLWNN